jgi:hypothetical protein
MLFMSAIVLLRPGFTTVVITPPITRVSEISSVKAFSSGNESFFKTTFSVRPFQGISISFSVAIESILLFLQ